ncbi:MAG: hypothetical protein Q4D81_09515 [Eubacteriales bacterium]|nr:hypothetical protein [Eubacteriales bacterium]
MKRELQKYLSEGRFGLEKESLRLNKYSLLPSVSDHPFGSDPNISRDFCEAQTEIITPVCQDTGELFDVLHELNGRVKNVLAQQDEILWNHSNPPAGYNVRKIRVAQFEGLEKEKKEYRKYLREKYGISKMLLCGIHFNFSFTQGALDAISGILDAGDGMYGISGTDSDRNAAGAGSFSRSTDAGTGSFKKRNGNSSGSFSDSIYLKLAANTMKYAWLITYLTAASPVSAFESSRGKKEKGYASLRCSRHGYWNNFIPTLDYTNLDAYIDSIQSLVDEGKLYSAWELYLPVRLKPKGANTLENLRAGISHIELRMLDINPLAEDGICKEDIDFLHLLLMMWAVQDPVCFDADAQHRAVRNMQRAALLDEEGIWIEDPKYNLLPVRNAALNFLAQMDRFYETWQDPRILCLIQYERRKILNHSERYAERIVNKCANYWESQAIIV